MNQTNRYTNYHLSYIRLGQDLTLSRNPSTENMILKRPQGGAPCLD